MRQEWQVKKLGDLCEVVAGQSPEGKFYNTSGEGMPFYQGKKDFGERSVGAPTTWTTQVTKIAQEGDVLMSVRAPVGPVNFATGEACIGRGLAAIRSRVEIDRDFLFNQLLYLQPTIAGKAGAVFPSISKPEIEALPLAWVALPEQRRLVGVLYEAFAAIATARANTERNLLNARELYESHVTDLFARSDQGWLQTSLAGCVDAILTGPFGSVLHRSDYRRGGLPLVNPVNIVADRIVPDARRTVGPEAAQRLARFALRESDVVIARRGEIGRCAVVGRDQAGWLCGTGCFVIRPSARTHPDFLARLLRSEPYRRRLEVRSERATMPSISNRDLGDLIIELPPVAQQRRISTSLADLSESTLRLATVYQRKLTALDALRQSLLHVAFTGAL